MYCKCMKKTTTKKLHCAPQNLVYLKVIQKRFITDGSDHTDILNFRVKVRITGWSDQRCLLSGCVGMGVLRLLFAMKCDTGVVWVVYTWVWRFIRCQNTFIFTTLSSWVSWRHSLLSNIVTRVGWSWNWIYSCKITSNNNNNDMITFDVI